MDQLASVGRFATQTALPVAENVAGNVGGAIETLRAFEQPGEGMKYLLARHLALQDPATRAALESSPLLAGFFNLPLTSRPVPGTPAELSRAGLTPEQARAANVTVLGPGETPQTRLAPSLPPLGTPGRAAEALAGARERLILAQPEAVARRELQLPALGGDISTIARNLEQLHQGLGPQTRLSYNPQTGNVSVSVGGGTQLLEFASPEDAAQAAQTLGLTPFKTGRGTYGVRKSAGGGQVADLNDPNVRAILGLEDTPQPVQGGEGGITVQGPNGPLTVPQWALDLQGQPPVGQAPTTPTTTAPSTTTTTQEPFQLPPGYTPVPGANVVQQAGPPGAGFPSPAFLEEGQAPPTRALPQLQTPAALPQLPALRRPGPGESTTIKVAPGVTRKISGGPAPKGDFTTIARDSVIPTLQQGKRAIQVLRQAGVLTDDYAGIAANGVRLQIALRSPNSPKEVRDAAAYIARVLPSSVPRIARAFGEQRTNRQEEARLANALTLSPTAFIPAAALESVIDDYIQLFTTGSAPNLEREYPENTRIIKQAYQTTLTPDLLRGAQPGLPQ